MFEEIFVRMFIHMCELQRREYKSKFLDMDTEYSRLKERMENMNHMLDDIQVNTASLTAACHKALMQRY
jgi:hypothetical protein